jgi:hypothetical protein
MNPTECTQAAEGDIVARIRLAATGSTTAPMVLLGNFEVENAWAIGERGLPRLSVATSRAIVDRMDEFAVLLADEQDVVLVGAAPDEGYLSYLRGLGLKLPTILAVAGPGSAPSLTERVLADPELIRTLTGVAAVGGFLWPHGTSAAEELLAATTGLRLATASAAVCKRVNSKVFSRALADELELRQPAGFGCPDVDAFGKACDWAGGRLSAGRTVVVKDAFGVSGKGMVVIRDRRSLDQVRRMVTGQAERSGHGSVAVVVEEWVAKRLDLNYQFTVGLDGTTRFDFVKEAITRDGVHHGHRFPARISAAQVSALRAFSQSIGSRLAAHGYFGVVGIDAIVAPDDRLFPIVEINARNNMSTYQERLRETLIGSGQVAWATHYPLRLPRRLGFEDLLASLDGLLVTGRAREGLIINNFGTVNALAGDGGAPFDGRLYGILVAPEERRLGDIDSQIRDRLTALERHPAHG